MNLITEDNSIFLNSGFLKAHLTPEIPLYRYRGNIDHAIDEIEKEYIFLSSLESLNDPFDSSYSCTLDEALTLTDIFRCFWDMCFFLKEYSWYKSSEQLTGIDIYQEVSLDEFSKIVECIACDNGKYYPASAVANNYWKGYSDTPFKRKPYGSVACFSEKWDSIPMWSYYANSHKGLCLKYDLTLLDSANIETQNVKNSLQKVWYSSNRFIDKNGMASPFIKESSWSHEQEWRLFKEVGKDKLSFPCLSEIYLGANFDWQTDSIEKIIRAIKFTQRNISLFSLRIHPETYSFIKIPIRY